jgi:hypothetical protein
MLISRRELLLLAGGGGSGRSTCKDSFGSSVRQSDVDLYGLAFGMFLEARNSGALGQQAVGEIILNRLEKRVEAWTLLLPMFYFSGSVQPLQRKQRLRNRK